MDRKLIRNYLYNALYQIVKIILPMILVPYTAVHIGESMLSIYQYAGSIMNWFILFGILGINTYGNRQIAKVRNNKEELNRTFFEIFYMQLLDMIVAMAAFYLFIHFFVTENKFYYELTGLTMIASMLDITWFFYGVEDFKKASIRNIIVKCLGVFLIMMLCKTPDDLWIYILINVGAELVGQGIMFAQLHQYITFEKISIKDAYQHHFKATFQLFVPTIAISVYTMLDTTMLGAMYRNLDHVAYYNTSMNIVKMFLTLITSIGSVVLPRVTNVYYNDSDGADKAQHLVSVTMKIACMLAFPMCFGMMAIAPNFISWYIPQWPIVADLVMLGCPIIIFISMSNVTGTQYMVPTGMYSQYTKSVVAGSIVNFCFNFIMIPRYGAYGAIIGSLIAEFSVMFIQLLMIRKKVHLGLRNRSYVIYIAGALLMFAVVYAMNSFLPRTIAGTLLQVLTGMVIYFCVLYFSKEELCRRVLSKMNRRKADA